MAKKRKKKGIYKFAQVHIKSTYNNTIITITDLKGNVLTWASAGSCGFSGTKKGTPYAATEAVKLAFSKAQPYGIEQVDIFVKGVGQGRDAAIRTINSLGYKIMKIKDVTPIPHNGCKPKKPRRV